MLLPIPALRKHAIPREFDPGRHGQQLLLCSRSLQSTRLRWERLVHNHAESTRSSALLSGQCYTIYRLCAQHRNQVGWERYCNMCVYSTKSGSGCPPPTLIALYLTLQRETHPDAPWRCRRPVRSN